MGKSLLTPKPQRTQKRGLSFPEKQTAESLHAYLDQQVTQYNTPAFITHDPVRFAHRFQHDTRACELVAFMAALFSYGQRPLILQTIENLLDRMDGDPLAFVENFSTAKARKAFRGFVYRFQKTEDLVFLCERLHTLYTRQGSLKVVFASQKMPKEEDSSAIDLKSSLGRFVQEVYQSVATRIYSQSPLYGSRFLLPDPALGGACKRLHLFLRWMVRHDDVDLGLWQDVLSPRDLIVPLDTHVASMGRALGLIQRRSNNWQTAEELTQHFRTYDPVDPVRYDFALFGLGIGLRESSKSFTNTI